MRISFARVRAADWLFVFAALTLVLLGLAAIYSIALSQDDFLNFRKQLFAAGIGLIVFFGAMLSNYRLLRNYAFLLYVLGAGCLMLVLALGQTVRGTTGWFDLGLFSFQPVEFMKLVLVVVLAAYFSGRAKKDFGAREFLESAALVALPIILVLLQPDMGSALLLAGLWVMMLLFAGMKKRFALLLLVCAVLAGAFAWNFVLADYQRGRISTFLDPSSDPLGQGYNVQQAVVAVGAGGWFGRGLGFGSQSQLKFLPESHTDFIFAVVAEEMGFVGVLLLLCAFFIIFARLFHYASTTHDSFTSFLLLGIGSILFIQFFVNVGMNIGLMPVTGLGLPLVSYGGSSLVFTLFLLGIVGSVALKSGPVGRHADML